MSASLARRIRRLGLKEAQKIITTEQVLVTDEQGKETVITRQKVRRLKPEQSMTPEERERAAVKLIKQQREKRHYNATQKGRV